MATVAEVQQLISEHQAKLEQIQLQFGEIARQIAAAELNGGKNIEELREQQFNLRFDVKHEEETLNYLQEVLVAAKRDEAIEQYHKFLVQHQDTQNRRLTLKEQIEALESQLKPLVREYEDGWQGYSYLGGRIDSQRRHLIKEYGVEESVLDAIKNEVVPAKPEAESG